MPRSRSLPERFWEKVVVKTEDECWEWQGSKLKGYGRINLGGTGGPVGYAHRIAYTWFWGEVPEDKPFICHICDNPACVNYFHLFAGNQDDNMLDRQLKKRGGHALDKEQVEQIKKEYEGGQGSTYTLADKYGVRQSTIWRIINGDYWKYV